MTSIAILALGFAVLARFSFLWGSLLWSLTLAILASSVVAGFVRQGRSRCFWVSFALLGWGYWYLAIGSGNVNRLDGDYPNGVRVAAREMKEYEARLERSATLPKYDIRIKPKTTDFQVS